MPCHSRAKACYVEPGQKRDAKKGNLHCGLSTACERNHDSLTMDEQTSDVVFAGHVL